MKKGCEINPNTIIEHDGRSLAIKEWAPEVGIKQFTIIGRIERGWTPERALTEIPTARVKAKIAPMEALVSLFVAWNRYGAKNFNQYIKEQCDTPEGAAEVFQKYIAPRLPKDAMAALDTGSNNKQNKLPIRIEKAIITTGDICQN